MNFIILAFCVAAVAVDPTIATLSADEIEIIKDSWRNVYHNEVDILYFIFKANPDIQAKFSEFADKDLESIKDTSKFAVQAGRIVNFFTEYIALMGRKDTEQALKSLLNGLGKSHADRGVTKEQFTEFRVSLIEYVKGQVSWGDNVIQAWNNGFDHSYYVIFSNLDGHPVL